MTRSSRHLAVLLLLAAGVCALNFALPQGAKVSNVQSLGAMTIGTMGTMSTMAVAGKGSPAVVKLCLASLLGMFLVKSRSRCALAAAPLGCIEDGATDPSLFVQTNVDLGDKKMTFMKAASKAVADSLGKPESYVAVSVQDGQDIIWGGSDAPCALCKVISLGSINKENNGALTKAISALLAEFDVPANRIYVNFFDLERQNVGYNGATFAG
eukprot:Skav223446  [mRNA]  locus=scaffold350:783546:784181:- [translate_table: standard]